MSIKPLVIYHGNCADGFGAAWAIWKLHPDWDFYPGVYQDDPPNVRGREVYLVDFSYKSDVVREMLKDAVSIMVIDHHKSAIEDLDELFKEGDLGCYMHEGKSGAMLAWEYFHTGKEPPQLIKHIQDRDLWKFELKGTREIQAALFSYPYDFEIWDELMSKDLGELYVAGQAIERKHHKDIAELLKVTTREFKIGGHKVKVANLPYTLTSDAGHKLAQGMPFGGCYWDTPEGRVFSLRSTDEGLDVSEIAKQYGGGGHRNASGFRVPFGHPLAQ